VYSEILGCGECECLNQVCSDEYGSGVSGECPVARGGESKQEDISKFAPSLPSELIFANFSDFYWRGGGKVVAKPIPS